MMTKRERSEVKARKESRNKSTAKKPRKSAPTSTSGKTAPAPENSKGTGKGAISRFQPGQSGNPARMWKPGQSGNPGGRPKSHGLLEVLRTAVDETVAKALVGVLIAEALKGRNPLPAIQTIFDRLEGKPKRAIDFNDITDAMKDRSPEDLLHYAQTGHWLEDENAAEASEEEEQHEES